MFSIKFIFINFIKWIKSEKRLFAIFLINLSAVSAVIIFLFSFNNQLLIEKIDNISKETYGRVYSIKGDMNDNIYGFLNILISHNELPPIEFVYLSGMADVDNKQAKIATVNFIDNGLIGYYYDDKYDITESNKVALATDTGINLEYGKRYDQNTKNISINGNKYDVVYTRHQFSDGMETMIGGVLVRMSYQDFVNEIKSVNELKVIYSERLDKDEEMLLRNAIEKSGFDAELRIQRKETSGKRNYKNEMIIDTILLFTTLLCLIKIYEYILNTREQELVIYRICGAKKSFIRKVLFLEIFVITIIGFFIGTIIFLAVYQIGQISNEIYFDLNTWIKTLVILFSCMFAVTIKTAIKLSRISLINIRKGI